MLCYKGVALCEDQNTTPTTQRFQGLSFRALLYLGDQDKEKSDDVMTRSVEQQIVCPPGFVPGGQECRPVMYNFTIVQSLVFLHFEPCGWLPTLRNGCKDIRRNGRFQTVLAAVQALISSCSQKGNAENSSVTFVVEALVTLRTGLAHYEEGRSILKQVQAWVESALLNVQLEIPGGPVGLRSGSFSVCMSNATHHGSTPPFYGATTISTSKHNQGHIHVGNVRLVMLVAAVWVSRYGLEH